MATTTTPRQILQIAYPKSTKNTPGQLATESGELLGVVNRAVRGLYAAAARINPLFFSKRLTVTPIGGAWAYPEDAESVFRLELAPGETGAGLEVAVVPYDQLDAERDMPRVYFEGLAYYPASADDGPTPTQKLVLRYSRQPVEAVTLNSTLDASWPEQFNELLALRVALYLAVKDGRAEEVAGLRGELAEWVGLFVAHLEHAVANERRAYGHARRFNSPSLVNVLEIMGVAPSAGAPAA